MLRTLQAHREHWPLAAPFRISRGVKTAADVVAVEIGHEGQIGHGEAVPYARYGETLDSVLAQIETVAMAVRGGMTRIELVRALPPRTPLESPTSKGQPSEPITIRRVIAKLNQSLDANMVVIADPGDALFASSELVIHRQTEFLSPAYYTSMGFAVPASLGAAVARPKLRPIVLVGDGAFQMTGMELSTVVRLKLNPIVRVLDNKGYGTERMLQAEPHAYNDVQPWNYHKLPEVFGGGRGFEIRTEGEFDAALDAAIGDKSQMSLLQVHLDPNDRSTTLERITEKLGARV